MNDNSNKIISSFSQFLGQRWTRQDFGRPCALIQRNGAGVKQRGGRLDCGHAGGLMR